MFLSKALELSEKILAQLAHMPETAFGNSQNFQRYRAGQRTSAKRRAVHAGMNAGGGFIRYQNRSQGKPRSQRFGYGDHIWFHTVVLVGEVTAGASQATLNLVENEQRSVPLGQLARE